MSYRDDLDAALARINALEKLVDGDDEAAGELRADNETLRDEVARLRQELGEARAEIGELNKRLYGKPASRDRLEEMPSLAQYNRQLPAIDGRSRVQALCPGCITIGERVEMVRLRRRLVGEDVGATVMCPVCGAFGVMKEPKDVG